MDNEHEPFHRNLEELEADVDSLRDAPRSAGTLELIVRRPAEDEREVLETAELTLDEGVAGDSWNQRASRRTDDGGPHPDMQLNIMSARAAALVAGDRQRWALAGDQLFVDLDLSDAALPAWTKLAIGDAVIQVTDQPHAGCAKFARRFGRDALKFVNSEVGTQLHLRGINAKVVQPGTIRVGDAVSIVD